MKKFRITKYNPSFRNERGEYILNEWTSYHDIGEKFYNGILTKTNYLKIENAYIRAIEFLMSDNDLRLMRIIQLEKNLHHDIYELVSSNEKKLIENMKNGMLIGLNDIKKVCKMILREFVWASLESVDKLLTIEFGYDYYMYVLCERISERTKKEIFEIGLFIEEMNH